MIPTLKSCACFLLFITSWITPASVDFLSGGRLEEKIDQYILSKLKNSAIPGLAVAIVRHDQVIMKKGYGITSDGSGITPETPFAIASLSKSFTALAVMQLVESGKIKLDESVDSYYPDFPISEPLITVRQLLNQTSALSDKVFPEMEYYQQPISLDASIQRLHAVRITESDQGTFHYHNPNYQILARIVELVSGKDFPLYLKENILEPLGMSHTRSVRRTSDFYTEPGGNLLSGYNFFFGIPIRKKEVEWFVEGSAGMTSNVQDMARWLGLFLNEGTYGQNVLLSEQYLSQMFAVQDGSYGMGWVVNGDNTAHHSGILWTYQAEQILLPREDYGIVLLFNSGLNAFQDYSSFRLGLVDIIRGHSPEPIWPVDLLLESLVGLFTLVACYFGILAINNPRKWEGEGRLAISLKVLLKIIPIVVLFSLPGLLYLLSGRVLNWQRVFWMMPSIVVWLGVQSLLNSLVILCRLNYLSRKNPTV